MGSQFAEELFRRGIPESKKFELIYREGPTLSPDGLRNTVNRLRADCRYARLLGALIDVSRNEQLAIEELFSENAVSPKIVAKCKWLYAHEDKGFVSEDFVRNTLPSVSLSSQKQILNRISKWVTNTELGDKLWYVANELSPVHSSMLLGACSNDLIMEEVRKDACCLSPCQLLDILRKRFDSGVELIKRMAEEEKFIVNEDQSEYGRRGRHINTRKLFLYILKQNFEQGIELLIATKRKVPFGHHSTRSFLRLISQNELHLATLLSMVEKATQRVLARNAPTDVYTKCFCARFKEQNKWEMLRWLQHLRNNAKLKNLEAWYESVRDSNLIDSFERIPEEFLFLLDEKTLGEVVTRRIALASCPDKYSEKDIQFWESMIPDDEESFNKQKKRLEATSSSRAKGVVYTNMLKSVCILKRPQYLERRLAFLVTRAQNDDGVRYVSLGPLTEYLGQEHRFTLTREIWLHLKKLFSIPGGYREYSIYWRVLVDGVKKTSFEQESLLANFMEELNRLQTTNCVSEIYHVCYLPKEKKEFFWRSALAYRETLEETSVAANGGELAKHFRDFYRYIANDREVTRDLIGSYPKTMQILKDIITSSTNDEGDSRLDFVLSVHKLLEPLLPPGTKLRRDLVEKIQAEERQIRETQVLKTFRKSKIITEELRALYSENCYYASTVRAFRTHRRNRSQRGRERYRAHKRRNLEVEWRKYGRDFIVRCGRSLLHTNVEQFSKWLTMLDEYIKENATHPKVTNTYRLKAMISNPSELKEEVVSLYPTSPKFDLWKGDSGSRDAFKQINSVRSLQYFDDSGLAFEMTRHFMKGDYLKETLATFRHHLSRLPVAKLISLLRESVLRKNSPVSARKIAVQGLLHDFMLFYRPDIRDVLQQLSVKEEHDNIKEPALYMTVNFVKRFGEADGWPMLKRFVDSIVIADRACITFLLEDSSLDAKIPNNLGYLMDKLVNFAESEAYVESRSHVFCRLARSVERLDLAFLLKMLEKAKKFDWQVGNFTRFICDFPRSIILYHAAEHADVLRSHFSTFGDTKLLDRTNSTVLTEEIVQYLVWHLNERSPHEPLDFLISVLEARTPPDLQELCLLRMTKHVLPLLLEEPRTNWQDKPKLETVLAAIRVTSVFLEEFGIALFEPLMYNFHFLLRQSWYYYDDWLEKVSEKEMSPMEKVILLRLNLYSPAKLEDMFSKSTDERIRAAICDKITSSY